MDLGIQMLDGAVFVMSLVAIRLAITSGDYEVALWAAIAGLGYFRLYIERAIG